MYKGESKVTLLFKATEQLLFWSRYQLISLQRLQLHQLNGEHSQIFNILTAWFGHCLLYSCFYVSPWRRPANSRGHVMFPVFVITSNNENNDHKVKLDFLPRVETFLWTRQKVPPRWRRNVANFTWSLFFSGSITSDIKSQHYVPSLLAAEVPRRVWKCLSTGYTLESPFILTLPVKLSKVEHELVKYHSRVWIVITWMKWLLRSQTQPPCCGLPLFEITI